MRHLCITAASAFLVLGSATLGAQESKDSGKWPPDAAAPGSKVPIPRSFATGISTSPDDLETIVQYGLSQPDPPPLPLPEDFHRTADRPGMTEASRKFLAADLAKPTPRLPSGRPDLNGPWKPVRYAGALSAASASPAPRGPNDPVPEPTPEQKAQAIALATFLRPANQPV